MPSIGAERQILNAAGVAGEAGEFAAGGCIDDEERAGVGSERERSAAEVVFDGANPLSETRDEFRVRSVRESPDEHATRVVAGGEGAAIRRK